jgi:AraC-like DNA-binding protein
MEQNQAPAVPAETQSSEAVAAPDIAKTSEKQGLKQLADKAQAAGVDPSALVELVIDGRKVKMPLKDAIAQAQRNMAADLRFKEAAKARKEIEELKAKAKSSPKALRDLIKAVTGEEPTKIFERELAAELEELSLDPKERELRKYKAQIEEYQAQLQEKEEAEKAQKRDQAQKYWEEKYDRDLSDAIKSSGLPLNEDTIRYAAEIMLAQLEIDDSVDPPMALVMELVKDRYLKETSSVVSKMDPEKLLELLGDDGFERIVKAGRSKKKMFADPNNQFVQESVQKEEKPSPWKSRDEFEAKIKEWASK